MHDCMEPGLAEDDHSGHLVEKDVVVKWEHMQKAHSPHQCDCVPQDEEEYNDSVEVEAEPVGPGEHEEVVGLGSITVVPKPVCIGPDTETDDIKGDEGCDVEGE